MIFLNDILKIESSEFKNWTLCLNNANTDGIYSFEENYDRLMEHIAWKKHKDSNISCRVINTNFCLQFIRLDRENKLSQWLFLGAFKVEGFVSYADGHETYNLKPLKKYEQYSERLVIEFIKKQGPKQVKIPIEKIPIADAFDELDTERDYYQARRKDSNERLISKKGMIGRGIGFAPMIVIFVGYLIIPLVFIGMTSMTASMNGLATNY